MTKSSNELFYQKFHPHALFAVLMHNGGGPILFSEQAKSSWELLAHLNSRPVEHMPPLPANVKATNKLDEQLLNGKGPLTKWRRLGLSLQEVCELARIELFRQHPELGSVDITTTGKYLDVSHSASHQNPLQAAKMALGAADCKTADTEAKKIGWNDGVQFTPLIDPEFYEKWYKGKEATAKQSLQQILSHRTGRSVPLSIPQIIQMGYDYGSSLMSRPALDRKSPWPSLNMDEAKQVTTLLQPDQWSYAGAEFPGNFVLMVPREDISPAMAQKLYQLAQQALDTGTPAPDWAGKVSNDPTHGKHVSYTLDAAEGYYTFNFPKEALESLRKQFPQDGILEHSDRGASSTPSR